MKSPRHQQGGERRRQRARTCIGCRRTAEPSQLLRLVRSPEGEVVYDHRRRLGGRGAWVCRSVECLSRALRSRRLGAAVGGAVSAPRPEEMLERIRAEVHCRVEGLLAAAGKARKVELGAARVKEVLRGGAPPVALVVLAKDLSMRVGEVVSAAACAARVPVVRYGDRDRLGLAFARRELGVAAVLDDGLARAIRQELALLERLALADDEMKGLPVGG